MMTGPATQNERTSWVLVWAWLAIVCMGGDIIIRAAALAGLLTPAFELQYPKANFVLLVAEIFMLISVIAVTRYRKWGVMGIGVLGVAVLIVNLMMRSFLTAGAGLVGLAIFLALAYREWSSFR